jgi:hypothetical protein
MQLLSQYIQGFLDDADPNRQQLGQELSTTKATWDVLAGANPLDAFLGFVDRYNWLGAAENKALYGINQNLARNLPGALMQDFLIGIMQHKLIGLPPIEVFTEVRVGFGSYPLWTQGQVVTTSPAQVADVTVGYRVIDGVITPPEAPNPQAVVFHLGAGETVVPLLVINSKIRVSQSEFFDWLGREELLTKGNPSCLSLQVALRAEMDLKIVEAAQAGDRFFLLGHGGETNTIPDPAALDQLVSLIELHLTKHMI